MHNKFLVRYEMTTNADISDSETEWALVKKCLPFFCEKLRIVEVLVHLESRNLLRPQQIAEVKVNYFHLLSNAMKRECV